jgi:hypothetical protein
MNMEGGGSSMMRFGENDMNMMMNSGVEAMNKQFLPLPLSENVCYSQRASAAGLMPEQDIETNNSCMRAKIMAHPLFPRLLAAYVNCQKVITFNTTLSLSLSLSLSYTHIIRGPAHGNMLNSQFFFFFLLFYFILFLVCG